MFTHGEEKPRAIAHPLRGSGFDLRAAPTSAPGSFLLMVMVASTILSSGFTLAALRRAPSRCLTTNRRVKLSEFVASLARLQNWT
jgi:hypothetical protein